MGLCFGAGHLRLGLTMLVLGWVVLEGLKWVEHRMKSSHSASLALAIEGESPSDTEINTCLKKHGYDVSRWSIECSGTNSRIHCELYWLAVEMSCKTPACVEELKHFPGVREVSWKPLQ